MKKLVLTEKGKKFKPEDCEEYWELSPEERLLADLHMYVDGAYVENRFKNVTEWSYKIADVEMETPDHKVVKDKIYKGIDEGYVIVLDY